MYVVIYLLNFESQTLSKTYRMKQLVQIMSQSSCNYLNGCNVNDKYFKPRKSIVSPGLVINDSAQRSSLLHSFNTLYTFLQYRQTHSFRRTVEIQASQRLNFGPANDEFRRPNMSVFASIRRVTVPNFQKSKNYSKTKDYRSHLLPTYHLY